MSGHTSQGGSPQEPRRIDQGRPRGGGWRELHQPLAVRCFLNDTWVDALALDVNPDTREIRVRWPPGGSDPAGPSGRHLVLDASHYIPAPGLLA